VVSQQGINFYGGRPAFGGKSQGNYYLGLIPTGPWSKEGLSKEEGNLRRPSAKNEVTHSPSEQELETTGGTLLWSLGKEGGFSRASHRGKKGFRGKSDWEKNNGRREGSSVASVLIV